MPIMPIAKAAIAEAGRRSEEGPERDSGICLVLVRECYGIGPAGNANLDGDADAFDAWFRSPHKHRETNPARIPRGVPIFWQGGSANHGHIAIATGFSGNCWSTDIKRKGFWPGPPAQAGGIQLPTCRSKRIRPTMQTCPCRSTPSETNCPASSPTTGSASSESPPTRPPGSPAGPE